MYGIFTYTYDKCIINVGKYSRPGAMWVLNLVPVSQSRSLISLFPYPHQSIQKKTDVCSCWVLLNNFP